MYSVMAVITLIVSVAWMLVLWKNRGQVFAIHYLMAMFMFIKVLSITFHAVSFFLIQRRLNLFWIVNQLRFDYCICLCTGTLICDIRVLKKGLITVKMILFNKVNEWNYL